MNANVVTAENTAPVHMLPDSTGDLDRVPARWVRPPELLGRCDWTGLSHASFYVLLKRAGKAVRVLNLVHPGKKRGSTLIWLPDLMRYLHSLLPNPAQARPEKKEGL